METRPLGKDGPQVSVVCFGAWPISGSMGAVPEDQAIAAVQAAMDTGMTFIDTAEGYRASESIIGKAIRGRRDQAFLATKLSGNDHSREHAERAIDNSLKALSTDYVDLYQIHNPKSQWPIEQTMENFLRLRDAGKIRYIGISNFSAEQTLEALKYGPIHSSQPVYNMFHRSLEDTVLPGCLDNGIGVIVFSPLGKGLLTGRYGPGHRFASNDERSRMRDFQPGTFDRIIKVADSLKEWAEDHGRDIVQLAIAWTLAHPAVTSAIVGAKSPEQVYHNARAADWRLTESDLAELDEVQGDLHLSDPSW